MLLLCNGIYLTVLSVHLPDTLCPSQATAGVEAPHPPGLSLLVTFCTSIPYSPIRRHQASSACPALWLEPPATLDRACLDHIELLRALGSGRD